MPFDLALHPCHSGGAHQIGRAEIGYLPAKLKISGCSRRSHSRDCGRYRRGRRRGWLCRGGRVSGGGRCSRWGSGRMRWWRHGCGRQRRVGRDCCRGQAGSGAWAGTRAGTRRWAGQRRIGGGRQSFCRHRDRNHLEFSDIPTQFCCIAWDPAWLIVAWDAYLQPEAISATPDRVISFPWRKP